MKLNGTVSREFDHFFAEKIRPGPHMNRQKLFRELFRFRKDIHEKRVSATTRTLMENFEGYPLR